MTAKDARPSAVQAATVWLPLVAAAVCLLLAIPTLGARDLWYDEAFSVTSTNQLWDSLIQRSGSMGLYYGMLALWSKVSIDPFWLRLPSALFAAAATGLAVRFTFTYFGRRTAAWTALILVGTWGLTRYAQEARSYTLVLLLAVTSWYLFFHLAEHSTRRGWIWWGICNAALVYSHPLAGLVPASQLVALRARPSELTALERRSLPGWLTSGVLLLPMVATFGLRTGAQPGWVPPLGWSTINEGVKIVAGTYLLPQIVILIALVAATVRLVARPPAGSDIERWHLRCLLLWLWVPPSVLLVISLAQPMFMGRYIIAVVPAAAIAIAATLSSVRPHLAALAAGAVIVAALAGGLVSLYRFEGHRWTGAVAHIESELSQDARHGIIFNFTHVRQPFEVNADGSDVLVETEPVSPAEPWGTNLRYPAEVSDAELAARLEDIDVLWEVAQHFDDVSPEIDIRNESFGFCAEESWWYAPIELTRFTPCARP